MPLAVTETPVATLPPGSPDKIWTRAECESMEASGLLDLSKFELIEGKLIARMGKNRTHSNIVGILYSLLAQTFGALFVQQEPTIDVAPEDDPTSNPEPDLVVLAQPMSADWKRRAKASQLRLVVEVSGTTLAFDRTVKANLYARAGVLDYWVADVNGRGLIVHRDPVDGRYTSIAAYREGGEVAPLAAPGSPLRVSEILPPTE